MPRFVPRVCSLSSAALSRFFQIPGVLSRASGICHIVPAFFAAPASAERTAMTLGLSAAA